ncbi:lysozyme [Chryseobacterium sp.]|nr:lysozyme [Chryseobacterium sp.]
MNQNQYNALVSFTYNVGTNALKTSTLLKRVNKNPKDPDIKVQFLKWVNSGGRKIPGLVSRRQYEAKLYFS